jgi:hypothetical protein
MFLSGQPEPERKEKMRKKRLALVLGSLFLLATSAAVLANLGDDNGGAVHLDINDDWPGDDDCICPMIYDPVVCIVENPDGTKTKRVFSNACVAGCHGYTDCNHIAFQR